MIRTAIAFLSLIAICFSCGTPQNETKTWMAQNGKLKVLSTIAMIHDLVKIVGGEFVDSMPLIRGELNPHAYQLVKGDDEKLSYADIIFYNGLGLEHGPSLQSFLHNSPKTISLGDQIYKQNPELILTVNGQVDPHIWMDASMWLRTINSIVEALTKSDPKHKDYYISNARKLTAEMEHTHDEIKRELQSVPPHQRYLVTSHDAFNYFARAYLAEAEEQQDNSWEKRFAAPEGLAPESQLSPTHIQEILDYVMKHKIYVLFPESNVSKDSIKKIVDAAKGKGWTLKIASDYLYADAMGEPGSDGDTYQKMIKHNAKLIAKNLKQNNHP